MVKSLLPAQSSREFLGSREVGFKENSGRSYFQAGTGQQHEIFPYRAAGQDWTMGREENVAQPMEGSRERDRRCPSLSPVITEPFELSLFA